MYQQHFWIWTPNKVKNNAHIFWTSHLQDNFPHPIFLVMLVHGILAHGAVGHVITVGLYLDGGAVEAKLGLQKLCSFLEDTLRICIFL